MIFSLLNRSWGRWCMLMSMIMVVLAFLAAGSDTRS